MDSELMNTRELVNVIEALEVGDEVTVQDVNGDNHTGEVVEKQRREQERRWLVKGDSSTEDCVLHVYYDIEAGPVTTEISFEDETVLKLQFAESSS